jgi:DNA polymerase
VMEPHHIIDVMAQAAASGLPPDLDLASHIVGGAQKDKAGAALIKLFCLPGSTATPQSHPDEWRAFGRYAGGDIAAMRSVFLGTRQLPLAEWQEYWAMEAINERGAVIDLPMVKHAAKLAAEDKVRSRAELSALTGGTVTTVDQVKRITGWLLDRLPPEGRDILTQRAEELDEETGEVTTPAKRALTRRRVERLIAFVKELETADLDGHLGTRRVLEIRLYGGSKTPAKFSKMLGQQIDGRLYGQYVFNGAGQTGRASSRGVQIHNLARDVLPDEHDAIEQVLAGCSYDELLAARPTPVARQLSLLIRPAFVAPEGRTFVWSDWSQIEARVLPWLCDHHAGARARLQVFRDVDADPSVPDLYTRTAATLSHVAIEAVTKPMRQRGKVAELALGFCGGVGALLAMAAGYGLHLSPEEARATVDAWRLANPWVRDFSQELWAAALRARKLPGVPQHAGRVAFTFLPDYLHGSLLCTLPSRRVLTYRAMRPEWLDVLDEEGEPTGEKTLEMTFARNYSRMKLWPGIFMENITQATAADFLRGTLVRLEDSGFCVRGSTHDEIIVECLEQDMRKTALALREVMRRGFAWSEGLPLMSEETAAYYYSKSDEVSIPWE